MEILKKLGKLITGLIAKLFGFVVDEEGNINIGAVVGITAILFVTVTYLFFPKTKIRYRRKRMTKKKTTKRKK